MLTLRWGTFAAICVCCLVTGRSLLLHTCNWDTHRSAVLTAEQAHLSLNTDGCEKHLLALQDTSALRLDGEKAVSFPTRTVAATLTLLQNKHPCYFGPLASLVGLKNVAPTSSARLPLNISIFSDSSQQLTQAREIYYFHIGVADSIAFSIVTVMKWCNLYFQVF